MVRVQYFRLYSAAPGMEGSAGDVPVRNAERSTVVEHLERTLEALENATDGLTVEQWSYRAEAGQWSPLDCIEHLVLIERAIFERIEQVLQRPPEPKQEDPARMDSRVLRAVPGRLRKVTAPEPMSPTGSLGGGEETRSAFREVRLRTIEFARTTAADLRAHSSPHFSLGNMDVHQWLLFLAAHTERHLLQLSEIRAGAGFPH